MPDFMGRTEITRVIDTPEPEEFDDDVLGWSEDAEIEIRESPSQRRSIPRWGRCSMSSRTRYDL